jgi:hypothetical protein
MARPTRARPAHGQARRRHRAAAPGCTPAPAAQSTIQDLAASLERVVFAAGATVFEEGEASESFYIVAAIHAELLRSDLPRTATVRAADDTILHVGVLARGRFIAP